MGTSTPYKGPRNDNPLLPDWLPPAPPPPPDQPPPDPPPAPEDGDRPGPDRGDEPAPPDPASPDPAPGEPAPAPPRPPPRFQAARRGFTDYAKSGGDDRKALGRAVRSFVRRAGGGIATTSARMARERDATVRLADILSRAAQAPDGIRGIARELDLGALADGDLDDLFAALADVVCPADGDLDDAHAKDAYLEAVFEVMRGDFADIDRPTPETIRAILGAFMTNAVHLRVVNAIANGLVTVPNDVDEVINIQDGLKDFIRGCVDDALVDVRDAFPTDDLTAAVDDLYDRAIGNLDARGDAAAEGEDE
jgi:hypothetical protein